MQSALFRTGLASGIVAAAATAGALVGIGLRLHSPALPFNVIAEHLLGSGIDRVQDFHPGITLLGGLVHVGLTCGTGICFSAALAATRGPRWIVALGVGIATCLASFANARHFGTGLSTLLSLGDFLIFYFVLGVALVVGADLDKPRTDHPAVAQVRPEM